MSSHGANAYYPWYVRDFRSSRKVQRLGYIARGFYRELLDEEFMEGSLPNDIAALADICGCPAKVMEKAWPQLKFCFEEIDGRLVNVKLEEIRTEKDRIRIKRAEVGRLGGLAKQSLANGKQLLNTCQQMPYSRAEQSKAEESNEEESGNSANASPLPAQPLVSGRKSNEPSDNDAFVATWNENRGALPKVLDLSDDRRKKLQTRIRKGLTIERFTEAVNICATTPFLTGENDRKWRASFDWLVENDSNLLKVLEGKYADSQPAPLPTMDSNLLPPRPNRVISLESIRAKAGIQ